MLLRAPGFPTVSRRCALCCLQAAHHIACWELFGWVVRQVVSCRETASWWQVAEWVRWPLAVHA